MKLSSLLLVSSLFVPTVLAPTVTAQTQLLRGKVEDVKNTQNRFVLDCTNIPLTSTRLNLNLLVGQQYIMQVTNTGTATSPSLEVQSVTATTKIFDMGNIRLGRSDRWQVRGKPNSTTAVGVTATSLTSYTPMGPLGTFLLGPNFVLLRRGTLNQLGVFEFSYQPPNLTSLVGMSFTGQALIQEPNGFLLLSNPDCKEGRPN